MSSVTPISADALLFDLGNVVFEIDFERAIACWAGHARCETNPLRQRFSHDLPYQQHEIGEIGADAYFASLRISLGRFTPTGEKPDRLLGHARPTRVSISRPVDRFREWPGRSFGHKARKRLSCRPSGGRASLCDLRRS